MPLAPPSSFSFRMMSFALIFTPSSATGTPASKSRVT